MILRTNVVHKKSWNVIEWKKVLREALMSLIGTMELQGKNILIHEKEHVQRFILKKAGSYQKSKGTGYIVHLWSYNLY